MKSGKKYEPNVEGWPWQVLGAIRSIVTVRKAAKILFLFLVTRILHDFTDFPSDKFDDI